MASRKEFLDYVLSQFPPGVTFRPMMGEYLLYYRGRLFGGIYDDRLLIKPFPGAETLFPSGETAIPYPGAKPLLKADPDDGDTLARLVSFF